MSLKDFRVLNKLGQGAYSSVYRVERLLDKMQYALKKVKLNNLSQKQQQNALNQVRILASINNKNIIAYKEAFIENNSLCIIMQFANGGDLYQKISDYKKQGIKFQQKQIWNVLIQITRGLRILHSLNIFHRDLKSANVFLTKQGISKLGDMNVSKISKNGLLYTQTGTPYYASPQVWKDKPYDTKSDIWSLGCVIYQMTTLKPPFRAQDMQGLYKKVLKGVFSKISTNYSLELWNVIKLLLQLNPELRPSSQMLLECKTIKQKIRQLEIQEQSINNTNDKQLLKTIRMPHKLHYLTDRLPKPNYTSFKKQHIKTQVNNHPESDFLRIANIINGKRYKQSFLSNGSSQNRYIYNSVEQKKYQNSIPFKHSIKKANNQKNYHKNSLKVVHKSINKQIYLPPIK